jgi:hypothetical protein
LVQTIWPALLMGAYAFTQRRDELARRELALARGESPAVDEGVEP